MIDFIINNYYLIGLVFSIIFVIVAHILKYVKLSNSDTETITILACGIAFLYPLLIATFISVIICRLIKRFTKGKISLIK